MGRGSLGRTRVIDVTANVAGPFATRILAALGADVIKVERPDGGDDTRGWGPPFRGGDGMTFVDLNRGKRSVTIDLASPGGRDQLVKLVESADVFVQNLRPGSLEKHGFGADELTSQFPRLVYCDIRGFGPTGPKAFDPAFDPLIQAYSGLMSITGEEGRPPVRIPVSIVDKGTALWAVIGILDSLRSRERTGLGGVVRTSLLETAMTWESVQIMNYLVTGETPGRLGSGTVGIGSYGAFATRDGYVLIAAGNDRLWTKACAALGAPELAADPRFATNPSRVQRREELTRELEARMQKFTTREAIEALRREGVPAGPVNSIDQAVAEDQVKAIELLVPIEHPATDELVGTRLPVTVSNGEDTADLPPPRLGEHNDQLLRD